MLTENSYAATIAKIKDEIETARLKAAISVNQHLLMLYWKIGNIILLQQNLEGWGTKVIERLSNDLRKEFPSMKGTSPRNLKYMRAFAQTYPEFVQPTAAQMENSIIVQQAAAQLPWFHICTLLDKVKVPEEKNFYIQKAIENNWSRNVLIHQIESGLYHRQGKAINNFIQTLPVPQSDLAKEMLKDPYKFDFLNLSEEYLERDLEDALVNHITKFLLELGAGFSYVGRQYHLEIGGEDFYIDLLFYHLKLRSYVVIELKTGKFIPEYASKLNFYLSAVDDILKHPTDNTTIGILICKERNKVVAEYALRDINKPIGITEYELTQSIPDSFKGSLPTIEEIENELES
ncbi:PDDEXK nuclease domain-containing protein [Mucilaginibacter sp. X4EP1]|uniref:PDDEXK nuclease domain-containing protein n=1 Tax=Mucilaginibacter sp. X4EP1 TaxID=2723092 RepID=UPI002167EC56|nr:PDDEXK nuclease domain-containing protein [Mucilaginibacter sp. X4EP1]MCS3812267.1 putative nuclease of restriction endonuclease-like (RecB) superfamily [Mucilaginibacter sp. X4EP1]